ncbi:MAG TPA: ABC transporter permease [Acidimicrobiales bacterium]|nr:ABC transporter permease [Acidimicrobiales bacterium]
MTDFSLPSRTITPKGHLGTRVRDIFRYRELLINLVRKDLKVRYKSSVLGFLWSLLNPAMLLLVYYFVFSVLLGSGIPRFPIYLLSGLLVWNLFNVGLISGTGSVVGASGIVNKVWFPREVLPLSAIGAAVVHFFLQGIVMIITLLVFQHPVAWSYLPLLPIALVDLLLFVAALALLGSAINVYLRDMQHLVEIALLPWFFCSPIVYSYDLIANKLGHLQFLYLLNPVTPVVLVFQRAIYGGYSDVVHRFPYWWYARNLAFVLIGSLIVLAFALSVFRRLEGNFTEEL